MSDAATASTSTVQKRSAKIQKKERTSRQKSGEHFEDAISDVFLGASVVVLPMLVLSAVFIGLVLGLRVTVPSQAPSDPFSGSLELINNTQSRSAAIFVDISAARLLTVASWTSTVTSFLAPWIMLLFSYYITARILRHQPPDLPTPFQLRLLIELCSGAYGTLWSWFIYRTAHRERKRGNFLVALSVAVLLLCLILSVCIFLADTWLHLTTTTVSVLKTVPGVGTVSQLSRALTPDCQQSAYCTVTLPQFSFTDGQIINVSSAYQTLFDISPDNTILDTEVGGRVYSFYAPADIPSNLTYRASTLALTTQCAAISNACNLTEQSTCMDPCPTAVAVYRILPFNCSSALYGDLTGNEPMPNKPFFNSSDDTGFFITYFDDAALTQYQLPSFDTIDRLDIDQYFVTTQPAHFAVGAKVAADPQLATDPEMVAYTDSNTTAFLLGCSSQVIEMTYTYLGGNVVDIVASNTSDKAVASITNPLLIPASQVWDSVVVGLRQAGLKPTVDALTASFAETYNRAVLSMGVGAITAAPSLQESTQTVGQITRMPKAPFIVLIAVNCLFALLAIVLAVVALASRPRTIKPAQARISVTGLVAALFEGARADEKVTKMSQLFEENHTGTVSSAKVGIEPTDQGGWRFRKI